MRHRRKTVKLQRDSAHRRSLLANLACSLIELEDDRWDWMNWSIWISQLLDETPPSRRMLQVSSYPLVIEAACQGCGVALGWGGLVDSLLQTSAPNVYSLGDCAEVNGHVLFYVAPLMNSARALAKTLAGEPTKVVYPAMPVTIKTPACPVVVAPPPLGSEGEWVIDRAEGNDVVARFVGTDGSVLGFALTGDGTRRKLELQKQLPALFGA